MRLKAMMATIAATMPAMTQPITAIGSPVAGVEELAPFVLEALLFAFTVNFAEGAVPS